MKISRKKFLVDFLVQLQGQTFKSVSSFFSEITLNEFVKRRRRFPEPASSQFKISPSIIFISMAYSALQLRG